MFWFLLITLLLLFATAGTEKVHGVEIGIVKGSSKLALDLTEPLTRLQNGKVTMEDLITNIKNYKNIPENRKYFWSVFYSINSQSLTDDEWKKQVETLSIFLNEILTHNSIVDLTISLPYKNSDFLNSYFFTQLVKIRKSSEERNSTFFKFNLNILLNLGNSNETKCDGELVVKLNSTIIALQSIKNNLNLSSDLTMKFGLGYDDFDKLVDCQPIIKMVDFLLDFVELEAFVESHGLFERFLDKIHKKNLNVLSKITHLIPPVVYHLKFHQNQTTCFERDFVQFASKINIFNDMQMVVPISNKDPSGAPDCSPKTGSGLVIPTILEAERSNEEDIKWHEKTPLQTIKKKFNFLLLTDDQWDTLALELSTAKQQIKLDSIPNIIIDYSLQLQSQSSIIDWKATEEKLLAAKSKGTLQHVSALVIPISPVDDISKDTKDFVSQMRNQTEFKFGCSLQFQKTWFSESELLKAFSNCEAIGGKYLIFSIGVDLNEAQSNDFSYTYYINSIQKSLNQVKTAKEALHDRKSNQEEPEVYIRVVIKSSPKIEKSYNPATVFCNENVLNSNEYYEAMLNWANKNNISLILKSAIDSINKPDISSWMSALRTPYSILSFARGLPQLRSSQPIFVLRNYPPNINGWKTEPCIQIQSQTLEPEEVNPDFRYDDHVGAVLNMRLKTDGSFVSVEEIQTMFQFIMHKFSTVEFVWRDAINVLNSGDSMSPEYIQSLLKNNLTTHTKFFMNYNIEKGDLRPEKLPGIYQKFREFQRNPLISAEGVHVHFSEIEKNEREGRSYSFSKMVASSSTIGSLKVGLVIPGNCMEELQVAQVNKTSGLRKAIKSMRYIVCREVVDVEEIGDDNDNGKIKLGTLFDSHLYIKRMLERDYPGIGLYFKLELDIDLGKNMGENFKLYKRFLQTCKNFATAYEIKYWLVEAFDSENSFGKRRNGWWRITDYSDVTNADVFVEKEAAFADKETWRSIIRLENQRYPRGSSGNEMNSSLLISLLSGIIIVFFILLLGSILLAFHFKKLQLNAYLTAQEEMEFRSGTVSTQGKSSEENVSSPEQSEFNTEFELSFEDIAIDTHKVLGTGQFGIVYKGIVKGLEAAIKIPTKNCGKETFKNVLGEVKVLCHLGTHQHIVGFLGAYIQEIRKGKLYIATELCWNGSLESYLRGKKNGIVATDARYTNLDTETSKELLFTEMKRFSLEIARGMDYIASKKVVHGDLAARNILLDSKLVCKISDFGLSRKVYEYQKYVKTSQEPLPWKWMAYESLAQMEFTSMSDMWSYGVTVWEIFSLGNIPYCGLNWTPKFADELRNGLRLSTPQFASPEIYEMLLQCWTIDVKQRPIFAQVADFFQNLHLTDYQNVL